MKILAIIKQAVVSLVTDDTSPYPQGQATYNGKPTNHTRLSPYGLVSNPPKDSWVLLLSSMAQSAVKFGIASDMLRRIKGLKEGECGLYNTLTQSFILLLENGDCSADIKGNVLVNATGNLTATIDGDISATAGGDITANAPTGDINASAENVNATATTEINLTAPLINLNGQVVSTGTMTAVDYKAPGEPDYSSHIHSQGNDSDGDTQQNVSTPI